MPKYLFVCNQNLFRSPWAADWCSEYCRSRGVSAEVRSAGVGEELESHATRFSRDLLKWADAIFVMEGYMKTAILEDYCQLGEEEKRIAEEKIVCLDIPDCFRRKAEENSISENMTPQEAIAYLNQHPCHIFGPKLFSKALEGKLEALLENRKVYIS